MKMTGRTVGKCGCDERESVMVILDSGLHGEKGLTVLSDDHN